MNKKEIFEEKVLNVLLNDGLEAEICAYGIRVKNSFDTWYIQVRKDNEDGTAFIRLYHKNLFSTRRSRNEDFSHGVPDSHLQFKGDIAPEGILNYIKRHGDKFTKNDSKTKKLRLMAI